MMYWHSRDYLSTAAAEHAETLVETIAIADFEVVLVGSVVGEDAVAIAAAGGKMELHESVGSPYYLGVAVVGSSKRSVDEENLL